ncbi:hypothetical protein GDO78_017390 [Eleutherodactylus coqui]|uniref:SCL-interrupting locus protein n=1 Tax=Eleutherodactylus coqui TaxID=57060 RepID=A0A8J6EA09_ELECQ|nr:hypothetical protein GDO78_017390 [Eleutherodactylus coqui]
MVFGICSPFLLDEEGITLTIDRFDPGREKSGCVGKVPSALLPGDFAIPCTICPKETPGGVVLHTPEDFTSSFKGLQSHLHSKEALDLSKLLTVRAHITYSENMDNLHFDLRWAAVTVANTFESTPIKPVPIIPTALARNLSSHNNIAQLQGTHKCGYLTMDQTRKLLLVLESDPKAYTLPLVGIWLSGITHIHSPQVWASCLRYMYSSSIKERVLSESGSFLIVLYSLTHKEPEFYECLPCIGHDPLGFQLLTCEDALHLFKVTKIHPCVPELSLVFGSLVEPRLGAQQSSNKKSSNKKVPPLSSTPKIVNQALSASCQHNDPHGKEFATKPSPMPFKNAKSQAMKPAKVRSTPADKPNLHPNAKGQGRRNSTSSSSSSSLSTPRTGSSPDSSVHQVRGSAELDLSSNTNGLCQEQPAMPTTHFSRQSPLLQSPAHNVTFPLPTRKLAEMPKLPPNYTPCHQTNVCSCHHNIVQTPCHTASSWPVMSGYVNHCGADSPSDTYPSMSCPATCCNALCISNCQKGTSRVGSCSSPVENVMSPGRRDSLPMNVCSPHSCQHSTTPAMPATNGMLGLSTEAYTLLAEQDRQLKLLQAQIQRLLEAQSNSRDAGSSQATSSTPKAAESVATETQEAEHTRKSSVSIAVGTGASLFWNTPPCPEEGETMDKQDESDLCNELSAAVNNEQDASRSSIASSLQAVDICSFAESSQLTDGSHHSAAAPAPVCSIRNGSRSPQSGNPNSVDLPALPPEKFYKDLLLLTTMSISPSFCSVLASINPAAVIPRLNYMSFTNIGLSGFIPNGADLSMEANAIALKYLSESQLTQLSMNHASRNKAAGSSSLHNLFPGSTEKSLVGLSVISLNNMSFATKKYLKRYNLIESNDGSDNEADSPSGSRGASDELMERHQRLSPDQSLLKDSLDFMSEPNLRIPDEAPQGFARHAEMNTLRNITNGISGKVLPGVQASEETSPRIFKDLNPKANLNPGKGQFTAHLEKENGRNPLLFNAKKVPGGSTGDILDVNRLRQLPKLF